MIVNQNPPEKTYPYLAVHSIDNIGVFDKHNIQDIFIISAIEVLDKDDSGKTSGSSMKPYVQRLIGGSEGYFTNNELDYQRLPAGYKIEITQ